MGNQLSCCFGHKEQVATSGLEQNYVQLEYETGDVYKGPLVNGLRHGKGEFQFKNGNRYEGEFHQGNIHGEGTFYYKSTGEMYRGSWQRGVKCGHGDFFYSNGSRYSGQWREDRRHGEGTITFEDFTKWSGKWKNDKRDGGGNLTDRDNKTFMQVYKDGKLQDSRLLDKEDGIFSGQSVCSNDSKDSLRSFLNDLRKNDEDSQQKKDKAFIKSWNTDFIVKWLEFLGLEQYGYLIKEHRVDGNSLLALKEKDMVEMGIVSKGHRMKLREGIENLKKKSQPKLQAIKIHRDYKKKHQYSLNSEMKLKQYYTQIEMIEEEEDDEISAKSEPESKRIKSAAEASYAGAKQIPHTVSSGVSSLDNSPQGKNHIVFPIRKRTSNQTQEQAVGMDSEAIQRIKREVAILKSPTEVGTKKRKKSAVVIVNIEEDEKLSRKSNPNHRFRSNSEPRTPQSNVATHSSGEVG